MTVKGQEGTQITFDFVFNVANSVGLKTVSKGNSFSLNEDIKFTAGFYSDGKKLVGKKNYENYTGTLVISPKDGGNSQYYPMEKDGEMVLREL